MVLHDRYDCHNLLAVLSHPKLQETAEHCKPGTDCTTECGLTQVQLLGQVKHHESWPWSLATWPSASPNPPPQFDPPSCTSTALMEAPAFELHEALSHIRT